ncbi:MAG: FtsW/RodA/SpoVE family cell cycle protein [Bacteroidales bacterium]|nr:FtsW/RodA/SpoVE family cell cycle protein [Bacteroidales bacterium]MBP5373872.1 FtsW/RodA/SpoVE family cell cycle protein [Bacteroidales bacterium]
MEESRKQGFFWSLMDRFSGDKVILLIALILMLISVISVFSSTPLLALEQGSDRMSIMADQLKAVALGFAIILLVYFFGRVELFRKLSMLGFAFSLGLLLILVFNLNLGIVRAASVNGARRILMIQGFQLHVYEFVKLFMIMYLGWALDTYKRGGFDWIPRLAQAFPKLSWLGSDFGLKCIYIYLPVVTVAGMVAMGSNSSALFITLILILMILIGGIDWRDIGILALVLILGAGMVVGAYKLGMLKENGRIATLLGRISQDDDATMKVLLDSRPGTLEYETARDELKQSVGAKLAIKEGGIFGKGIGNSTQKYAVPVIFGDYMYSFIVEETGLWGAAILLLLYFSLLARGTMVAKECNSYYDKMTVIGLILLVTGQAFMHMAVNVHLPLVPQTGQTLPLVSHGTNALLVFSLVFGILLCISKDARENMARREQEAEPIIPQDNWTQDSSI